MQLEDAKRKRVTGKGGVKVLPEKPPQAEASAADQGADGEVPGQRKRVLTAYGVARADYMKALLGL